MDTALAIIQGSKSLDNPTSLCLTQLQYNFCKLCFIHFTKAELPQEVISFRTQFPSLEIFNNKKVGFRKN